MISKSYVLLSPEYEEEYEKRQGRQPKYIPTDFISNKSIPVIIQSLYDYSRTWMKNPKYKKAKK